MSQREWNIRFLTKNSKNRSIKKKTKKQVRMKMKWSGKSHTHKTKRKRKTRQIINKKNKTAMTFREQIHSPHQAAKTKRIFHHNIQAVFPFGWTLHTKSLTVVYDDLGHDPEYGYNDFPLLWLLLFEMIVCLFVCLNICASVRLRLCCYHCC